MEILVDQPSMIWQYSNSAMLQIWQKNNMHQINLHSQSKNITLTSNKTHYLITFIIWLRLTIYKFRWKFPCVLLSENPTTPQRLQSLKFRIKIQLLKITPFLLPNIKKYRNGKLRSLRQTWLYPSITRHCSSSTQHTFWSYFIDGDLREMNLQSLQEVFVRLHSPSIWKCYCIHAVCMCMVANTF